MPRFPGRIESTAGPTGRMVVLRARVFVHFPRFRRGRWVDFLVDTGATRTALHPQDWALVVPPAGWLGLRNDQEMFGIGGSMQYAREPVVMLMVDDGGRYASLRQRTLFLGHAGNDTIELLSTPLPSLLGMDVLSTGALVVEFNPGTVVLDLPADYVA